MFLIVGSLSYSIYFLLQLH